MSDLEKVREDINELDKKLIELLVERRNLSSAVISLKDSAQSDLRDPKREHELLLKRIEIARERGLDATYITKLFHEVIEDSVKIQQEFLQKKLNQNLLPERPPRIAFQGIDGSYAHLAGKSIFAQRNASNSTPTFQACGSFADVVQAVDSGQSDYGILPIETTTSGAMDDVYDLLFHSRVSIVGEEKVSISFSLLGLLGQSDSPVSHLKKIYCSILAARECSSFLAELTDCEVIICSDSGLAAKKANIANSSNVAAIAGQDAAQLFGLSVLRPHVGDYSESFTRYIIISKNAQKVDKRIPAKTSLVVSVVHRPGALVEVLAVFRDHKLNLTKLENRPVPNSPWEEMFYLDFEGNLEDQAVIAGLQEVRKHSKFLKILGCYPNCDVDRTLVKNENLSQESQALLEQAMKPIEEKKISSSSGKGYKLASRDSRTENTVIQVGDVKIGDGNFLVMAGPCSVESREQILACAKHAKDNGVSILRGGVFKPRTSPYSFQGMGYEGLELLVEAGRIYNMPVITEVMTEEDLERVAEKADIIQIGARNMQNFSLLKACGRIRRPIMMKRGMSASIDDVLQAVEYILAGGNQEVILCERGIRTFETATRSTLDISAVPVLKERTHLPVFVDPSHAAGIRELVSPLSLAAKAVGADGIIFEFHPEPEKALSDGPQALRFPQVVKLMRDLGQIRVCE